MTLPSDNIPEWRIKDIAREAAELAAKQAGGAFFATGYYLHNDWALASDYFLLLTVTGAAAYILQFRQVNIKRSK